jgi:hypothetical protein
LEHGPAGDGHSIFTAVPDQPVLKWFSSDLNTKNAGRDSHFALPYSRRFLEAVAAESLDAALRYMRHRFDDFTITEARLVGVIPLLSGAPLD